MPHACTQALGCLPSRPRAHLNPTLSLYSFHHHAAWLAAVLLALPQATLAARAAIEAEAAAAAVPGGISALSAVGLLAVAILIAIVALVGATNGQQKRNQGALGGDWRLWLGPACLPHRLPALELHLPFSSTSLLFRL